MNNEQIIRGAYELAEKKDIKGWVDFFTPDGTFTDMSIGFTYSGPDGSTGLGKRSAGLANDVAARADESIGD